MGYIWNVSPDGDLGTRSERCEQKDSRNRYPGYADIVLYILCTLYRDELVAINLMERLGPDLDMKMHLKPFDKGQDIHDIQNPDTLRICMHLIVHLSFTSRGVIRQLQELRKDLKPILNLVGNCNSEKRKEVLSLLERLRFLLNVYAESQENDAKDEEGHIMISFSWQQQSIVILFVERLRKKGYAVWLDLDYMSGDTVEAISEAVEISKEIIMCVSKTYTESHNYMYANQLKKPIIPLKMEEHHPDGLLGMLMGVKMYYDGTTPIETSDEISSKELGLIFGVSSEPPPRLETMRVYSWDTSQVIQWLKDVGYYSKYNSQFESLQINGKALLELRHIHTVDSSGFHKIVREKDSFHSQ